MAEFPIPSPLERTRWEPLKKTWDHDANMGTISTSSAVRHVHHNQGGAAPREAGPVRREDSLM
jgi:hypothetical protein